MSPTCAAAAVAVGPELASGPQSHPRAARTRGPALQVSVLALAILTTAHISAAETWAPVRWHGENTYELSTPAWHAIVSIDRGRLIFVGPPDRDENFVYAPPTKDSPTGWGGHRVWLGPQDTWPAFWPPPDAWERSAPERTTSEGARLTLLMPDAGNGWPRLTRIYELVDGKLACRVQIAAGGTRDVQIMQILQTRPSRNLTVPIVASEAAPLGCVLLPPFQGRHQLEPLTAPLDYMMRTNAGLQIRPAQRLDKIGFPPQELVAQYPDHVLRIGRGPSRGDEIGAPDEGFYTQICPGQDDAAIVELEQMSPLYRAGEPAEFTMMVGLSPR